MAMSDTTRPEGGDGDKPPYDGDEGADPFPFAEEEAREDFAADGDPGQLDLGEDDTRLPWLEGADDDEEYEGYNTGQVMGLVLMGILLLGVIVGGIWWLTHRGADDELVADGSTIAAPDEPYKEKPEDPGGLVADGTGDASYRVSEGQSPATRLGEGEPVARPGFDSVSGASASPGGADAATASAPAAAARPTAAPSAGAAAAPAAKGGVGVQIGAYSSRKQAEDGWASASQNYSALSGATHRIVEGKADIGTVYRLQAIAADRAAADELCRKLKASGLNCYVKP